MRRRKAARRSNPMPTKGAIYLSNTGKAKKAKKSSSLERLFARWKPNGAKRRTNKVRGTGASLFKANRKKTTVRRRNSKGQFLKNVVKANGVKFKANRRHTGTKVMHRRNGMKVKTNRRRNPAIMQTVAATINKVPVLGKYISPYAVPGLFGLGGFALVHMALKYSKQYLPAQVHAVGYSLGGLAVATVLKLVGKRLPMKENTTNMLALTAVLGGVAVDAFRYATKTTTLGADDDMQGLALGGLALGDGGMWQVAPYSGLALGADGMADEYADACGHDADYCGDDLDATEGRAALAGPFAWRQRFPAVVQPIKIADPGRPSRHAGAHGHRWGWLIRLIGYENFRKVAAMPKPARMQYIHALRLHATSTIPGGDANVNLPAIEMDHFDAPVNEPVETAGFGSLLYAGTGAGAAF